MSRVWGITAVCGDDEQREVDATNACQHVADEALVSRHVDEANLAAIRERKPGEPQVDGHAADFLFLQPVGIDTGEGRTSVDLP